MPRIKYIKGNIIAQTGFHIAKDFYSLDTIPESTPDENIINGDLLLTSENIIEPFFEYHATGYVSAFGMAPEGSISILSKPERIHEYVLEELNNIKKLAQLVVEDKAIQQTIYKQCISSFIASYELFVSDILISLVVGDSETLEKFIDSQKIKVELKDIFYKRTNTYYSIIKSIEFFNYHDTKQVNNLLDKLFNFKIKELEFLDEYIKIRNNLAHRNGHPKHSEDSGPEYFTENDVIDCYNKVSQIIESIYKKLNIYISRW